MPILETARLTIRPFALDDFQAARRILDEDTPLSQQSLHEREEWLRWSVLNHEALARLYQPPYGDRAAVLKATGQVIGACGYVPCLWPFGQYPSFQSHPPAPADRLYTAEVGLFYTFDRAYRRQGYATEAAQALIDYAFGTLRLRRIVATTSYENDASMGVMRRLGMRVERNPFSDPQWAQIVGLLENNLVD